MQKKIITIGQQRIHYKTSGQGDPLIILHGWGIFSDYFIELQKNLAKQFTVYNLDLPGFGQSDLPKEPWSVDDYADFLDQFIKKINLQKIHLFGHSFGGRISLKYAVKYPAQIDSLILCASAGLKPSKTIRKAIYWCLAKTGKTVLKIPGFGVLKPYARKLLYRASGEHDYAKLNNKIMQETFKKVIQEDLKPLLNKIKAPTLLLWGLNDKLTPIKDGQTMNNLIKNSKLITFPDVGHRLPYEKPKEVAKSIFDFIK